MKQIQSERTNALCQELWTQVGLLCESHISKPKARDASIRRIFSTVMKLLPRKETKIAKRTTLVELLQNCAFDGVPTVITKGESVYINGNFDLTMLCSQIVFKSTITHVDLTED